jgi:predicted dehydrogenase
MNCRVIVAPLLALAAATAPLQEKPRSMPDVRLMTVDPGHFHAALVQKEMYPGVAPRVDVYAPLSGDLYEHLKRLDSFNRRPDKPTAWQVEVHAAPDFFERMLAEHPGNVVVLSGRNGVKIDRVQAAIGAGLHVLADKPWILKSADMPKLESALAEADRRGLGAYDIMTERFEVTSLLQRLLVNDAAVFGEIEKGSEQDPAVYMESVHYLMKTVAGAPNIRPVWFFDTSEEGEGLSDVGTHLVDLVQWTLFPEQALDYRTDVRVLRAQRWPTLVSQSDFRRVTGEAAFPSSLTSSIRDGALEYYCNTLVAYALRGVHITLNVIWDWEAQAGGDTHFAYYKGTKSKVEIRQTQADAFRPELFVVAAQPSARAAVLSAVRARIAAAQREFPGVAVEERGQDIHVTIPDALRVGHEAHFGQVTTRFLGFIRDRATLPAWERPNMLAKYYVTTMGTELARQSAPRTSERRAPR